MAKTPKNAAFAPSFFETLKNGKFWIRCDVHWSSVTKCHMGPIEVVDDVEHA